MPLRWPCLLVTCSTDVYCSKQTGSSTKGNHHPSFSFLNWAEETVDAAKICGGAEKMLENKTETQQKHCKWIARFYYLC